MPVEQEIALSLLEGGNHRGLNKPHFPYGGEDLGIFSALFDTNGNILSS
jgi:hypothetical protein